MADEVFALSPISARAVQPSEADYDAIKEAFMETSRGRWFLGEYAKRNRNADTRMVLDAVARIEETIAAQKKPVRDPLLYEALASLRAALAEARDATAAAIDDLAIEQNLAPVRKGARVIREIAWRLREIGADGRICDLIDSQVTAIEGAAAKLAPSDLAGALGEAFDRIEGKIAAFGADEASASPPQATPPEAADATPAAETQAAPDAWIDIEEAAETGGMMRTSPVAPRAKATAAGVEATAETATDTTAVAAEPAVAQEPPMTTPAMTAPAMAAASETASEPVDAFDAGDEAVLDMVAMEMAAPDTDEAYEPSLDDAEVYERQIQEGPRGEKGVHEDEVQAHQIQQQHVPENRENQVRGNQARESQAEAPQADRTPAGAASWEIDVTFASDLSDIAALSAMAAAPVVAAVLPAETALQAAPEPKLVAAPAPDASLGSSLLANGIVQRPRPSGPDPLAPIRRMSQNERIAFFS